MKRNRGRFNVTVLVVCVVFYMQSSRRGSVAVDTCTEQGHWNHSSLSTTGWLFINCSFIRSL